MGRFFIRLGAGEHRDGRDNIENHYPIGYFVTESILHLKLMWTNYMRKIFLNNYIQQGYLDNILQTSLLTSFLFIKLNLSVFLQIFLDMIQ